MSKPASLHQSIMLTALFLLLIWWIKFSETLFGWSLHQLGVYPHAPGGLVGIITAPLIHGSWMHLFSNTLPILLLGSMLVYGYPKSRWWTVVIVWLVSGLGVWLFGRESFHFGASGLAHGLFFFLLIGGILRRDKRSMVFLMIAFFMYGSMTLTIFPREPGISFEYHLFGAVGGVICALLFRHWDPKPQRKVYEWELQSEDQYVEDPIIGDQWKMEPEQAIQDPAQSMHSMEAYSMSELFPPFDYAAARAEFFLPIPEHFNFAFDVVGKRARENDKTALIAIDRSGEQVETHSYGDLDRGASRFANALLEMGVNKGEFAFVMMPRIPEWYHVLLGCTKLGVVSMPGTNLLTAKDIEYRVNRAGASLAIVTHEHVDKVNAIFDNCPTLKKLVVVRGKADGWTSFETACAQASDELDRDQIEATKADELMLIYFTSGTTSMPKMVGRDHAYGLAHSITGDYWMGLREDDVHWTLTDTGWAKAAWGLLYPPLLAGATIVLYDGEGFDAEMHLRIIEEQGVTTFCAPPTIYRAFAQMDLSGYDLSSLRHCFGAGEPLNPEAMRFWKEATGCDIYDGYGQTETINIVANFPGMEVRPGSMGKPVPGLDVDVIDDDGKVVADDEVGHIGVRITDPWPPGLFHGYFKDEEATKKAFRNGWYYTGDTARRDADGYIWFVGRSDDIIGSSGYRISPFEVESVLVEHAAVLESAVVAKPDEMRGEVVMAFITLAPGFTPSDALKRDIQDYVKSQTAPYKYPREIVFMEALPKTISGKIRRVELREQARNM